MFCSESACLFLYEKPEKLRRRPRTWKFRVLVKKGVVGFNTYGKIHEYYPEISRKAYFRKHVKSIINNHFEGSAVSFASFFTGDDVVDLGELEEIKALIDTGFIVVCCGGGGIPVVRAGRTFDGVDAVIDKDLASACLAAAIFWVPMEHASRPPLVKTGRTLAPLKIFATSLFAGQVLWLPVRMSTI